MTHLDGLQWSLLSLIGLVFLQRSLHRELQAVFLLLTRRQDFTLVLFSLIFLPGVFLHEISHYLMAKILRVPTGRFSVIPRQLGDGRLLMGYVETAQTDIVRDALIGAAPLVTGGLFVAYVGRTRLGLVSLWDALSTLDLNTASRAFTMLFERPDFWLWFYLAVAVSSTMMPSSTDRRAWLQVGLVIALVLGVALLVGIGPWMMTSVAPKVNDALRSTAVVLAMSGAIHFAVLIPALFLRRVLSRIFRLDVALRT
ncbi:MAG: hypothetical protein H8D34_32720 [Chloroflexi bacterium]|nr:hypothetical protein [Chloroflexota bacterium]